MGKHRIPPDRYIPGKNPSEKRFVKSRQCAAIYTVGNRAGNRCTWYARADSIYCARHGRGEGKTLAPERIAKMQAGAQSWWTRLRELEAKHPGLMRQVLNVDEATETRQRRKEVRREMPAPKTDDPVVLKAHTQVVALAAELPRLPDKPFEQMEPHEQLVAITGKSLRVVHEILGFKMTDTDGVPNPKIVSIVKDTALRALAVRVKVDRNALAARRADKMAEILERLTKGETAKVIDG